MEVKAKRGGEEEDTTGAGDGEVWEDGRHAGWKESASHWDEAENRGLG